jgi:hypothetical protein
VPIHGWRRNEPQRVQRGPLRHGYINFNKRRKSVAVITCNAFVSYIGAARGRSGLPLNDSDCFRIFGSSISNNNSIDSWRRGAVALWLDPDGIAVESANESRGDRPWVPHPRRKPPVPEITPRS